MNYQEPSIPLNSEQPKDEPGVDWLKLARDAFSSSTSYMDANWRKQWEDNIAMFQSRHPTGSKYNSEAYKHRSRLFRPKTRSVVRKNEAAMAVAFFSNPDVVTTEAENDADPLQVVSAELMQHILNYRLQKTIPWFQVLIGGAQTAQVIGMVCSYQYWHYKEKVHTISQPITDELGQPLIGVDGQPVVQYTQKVEVLKDEPCVEILPPEQFRFDPGADWLNVVKTSPYFIRMVPMYVADVRMKMQAEDRKTGQSQWTPYTDAEIRMAMADHDTLRQARENKRQDPLVNNDAPIGDFEIVWCHENFVRIGDDEKVYWTLGAHKLLTEPQDLKEVYFTGERPFAIGTCVLEANKAVPGSLVEMGASLQRETNETVNQRRDNVSLVLNKRWFVKRGREVDVGSLSRNVAGGVTMMTDPTTDVVAQEWNDVTASAYQEQDRLNVDFDELTGNFSSSSVMTNRKLNETVGGMNLLSGGANQLTEYLIRTLVETWVEPVLRQLVKLEQAYETNTVILGLAGQKAMQTLQRFNVNQVTDELLQGELTVRVNVGMGATDPQTKLQKFTAAMGAYGQMMQTMPDIDPVAVRKELFGLAGYKDGTRFFKQGVDPKDAQLQKAMQMIQQQQQQLGMLQNELQQTKVNKMAQSASQLADVDLKQAQTVATLVDAALAPSQALMSQATEPESA